VEVVRPESWEKPLLEPDGVERPFYEAAARGELLYQQCPECGHRQFYPRPVCTECAATPEWATASGRGRVHTFTVIRQYHAAHFRDELPYVLAMVELEEGVRMFGTLTGCEPEAVAIDMPVEAYAVEIEDGIAVPFWRPAQAP